MALASSWGCGWACDGGRGGGEVVLPSAGRGGRGGGWGRHLKDVVHMHVIVVSCDCDLWSMVVVLLGDGGGARGKRWPHFRDGVDWLHGWGVR